MLHSLRSPKAPMFPPSAGALLTSLRLCNTGCYEPFTLRPADVHALGRLTRLTHLHLAVQLVAPSERHT
jgi:hypothetical protein